MLTATHRLDVTFEMAVLAGCCAMRALAAGMFASTAFASLATCTTTTFGVATSATTTTFVAIATTTFGVFVFGFDKANLPIATGCHSCQKLGVVGCESVKVC